MEKQALTLPSIEHLEAELAREREWLDVITNLPDLDEQKLYAAWDKIKSFYKINYPLIGTLLDGNIEIKGHLILIEIEKPQSIESFSYGIIPRILPYLQIEFQTEEIEIQTKLRAN